MSNDDAKAIAGIITIISIFVIRLMIANAGNQPSEPTLVDRIRNEGPGSHYR
jgi:hypothetical protein